jgi:hypothetical protein
MVKAFESYKPHKNSTATVVKGGVLGHSMTESHKKLHFLMMPLGKFIFQQMLECSLH